MDEAVRFRLTTPGAAIPARATAHAAGYDCVAALGSAVTLQPGERRLVPLGFEMALPETMEAQIRPRSGLALKHGVTLANAPGTIDADYRGEVSVILVNLGMEPFTVEPGMRIAQMVFARVEHPAVLTVNALDATDRGAGGFGHSGV